MRLSVLYATDGSIVSMMRFAEANTPDVSGVQRPQIAVQPARGERVAIVDVDPAWDRRLLVEIHQAFTVADGADGPYLRARDAGT